ncbi:MAG: hypothetical protein JNL18_02550 [Planctomycetaceae bacterium]|nr:hypothetical protein [Planctomycetaceae bacterium]
MRTRDAQLLTTLSLLALMGVVGGLGGGLHSWFGCCCERTFSSTPESLRTVEVSRRGDGEHGQAPTGSECPVCSLLARYYATPVVVTNATPSEAIVAWRCEERPPTLQVPSINWRQPRGPPSLASAS